MYTQYKKRESIYLLFRFGEPTGNRQLYYGENVYELLYLQQAHVLLSI